MSRSVFGLLISMVIALGLGYWLGQRATGGVQETSSTQNSAPAGRKILYYRNPMGLPDTSPVPKKDSMGMEYTPVYADEASASDSENVLQLSTDKVQKLGVKTDTARLRNLDKTVRAVGRIEPDERRIYTIAPKFEGYIEHLYANAIGQSVVKGQTLFDVYSPELVSAQQEYTLAHQGQHTFGRSDEMAHSGIAQLADASLARLRHWDISESQINTLSRTGQAQRTLSFQSPVSGVITDKKASQGMRFMPGEALYQVSDLTSVWVIADVFEQDIAWIKTGAMARVRINAYPDKNFQGRISYVYPTMNTVTRTVPVRIELPNPEHALKPGMFAQLELPVPSAVPVITVPISAVIDSGVRQIILVQIAPGRFEPRVVKLGARSEDYVEVIDGVRDGETVVVSANFLIDAESNLKAAVSGLGFDSNAPTQAPVELSTAPEASSVGHHAEGRVEKIEPGTGMLTVSHGPVASLNWPAMTMAFKLANPSLVQGIQPGSHIAFEFIERAPGEWVVTSVHRLNPEQNKR